MLFGQIEFDLVSTSRNTNEFVVALRSVAVETSSPFASLILSPAWSSRKDLYARSTGFASLLNTVALHAPAFSDVEEHTVTDGIENVIFNFTVLPLPNGVSVGSHFVVAKAETRLP